MDTRFSAISQRGSVGVPLGLAGSGTSARLARAARTQGQPLPCGKPCGSPSPHPAGGACLTGTGPGRAKPPKPRASPLLRNTVRGTPISLGRALATEGQGEEVLGGRWDLLAISMAPFLPLPLARVTASILGRPALGAPRDEPSAR
ncbi:hypothetical protein AAFF_G00107830 [Aldrovandia affinis]|uniref:Uncharacterized protein n=1 Tax=Aldrovandia affinis TaxID=143900 RepID=A0AAD7WC09_9TELE|nr:hypothetical protein AAFF_G00107830 [Aldrovandia affinis]